MPWPVATKQKMKKIQQKARLRNGRRSSQGYSRHFPPLFRSGWNGRTSAGERGVSDGLFSAMRAGCCGPLSFMSLPQPDARRRLAARPGRPLKTAGRCSPASAPSGPGDDETPATATRSSGAGARGLIGHLLGDLTDLGMTTSVPDFYASAKPP